MILHTHFMTILLWASALTRTVLGKPNLRGRGGREGSFAAAIINEPHTQRELRPEAVGVAKGFFDGSSKSGRSSASYDSKPLGSNFALQGFMFDYEDGGNHGLEKMIVAPNTEGVSVTLNDGDASEDKFSWKVTVAELPSDSKNKWINGKGSGSFATIKPQDCDESPVLVSFHIYYDDDKAHNYNEFGIDLNRMTSLVGDGCSTMIRISLADSGKKNPFKFQIQYALVNDLYVDDYPGQQIEGKGAVGSPFSSDSYTCSTPVCLGEPVLSGFHVKSNGPEFPIDMFQVGVENFGVVNGKGETAAKGFASLRDINGGERFDWFVRYTVVMDRVPSNLPHTLPTTTTTATTTTTTTATTTTTTTTTTSIPPPSTPDKAELPTTSSGAGDIAQTPRPPPTTPGGADNDPTTTTTRFASRLPETMPTSSSTLPTLDAANNDPTTTQATTTSGPREWPCGVTVRYFLVIDYGDNPQEIRVKVNPQVIDLGFGWTRQGIREEEISLESGGEYVLVAKGKGSGGRSNRGMAQVVQRVGIQNGLGRKADIEDVLAEIDFKKIGRQAKKHFAVPDCRI